MAKGTRPPKMKSVKVSKTDPWMNQRITLKSSELPELKEWKVGEKYKLEVEVKQTSTRQDEGKPMEAEFTITKVKAIT